MAFKNKTRYTAKITSVKPPSRERSKEKWASNSGNLAKKTFRIMFDIELKLMVKNWISETGLTGLDIALPYAAKVSKGLDNSTV